MQKITGNNFSKLLLQWHETANNRSLPWKNEADPYKIWLSEIILQQTRALQGLPYYLRFIEAYPTISHLANANQDQVYRLWQGLGYYNRCKNMLSTARYIVNDLDGIFPDTYQQLLSLKGVGVYTASAIASFAYNLPHAVVDGNVYRVLSRYFCIQTPFDTAEGKKEFASLAQSLIDTKNGAEYNQAIIDLGATICLPRLPKCIICPFHNNCLALQKGLISILPQRSKKIKVSKRYFHYIIIKWQNNILLHKRTNNDIWKNLFEPFLIENNEPLDLNELKLHLQLMDIGLNTNELNYFGKSSQKLTHQIIITNFFVTELLEKPIKIPEGYFWVHIDKLNNIAFPKTVLSFLEKKLYL